MYICNLFIFIALSANNLFKLSPSEKCKWKDTIAHRLHLSDTNVLIAPLALVRAPGIERPHASVYAWPGRAGPGRARSAAPKIHSRYYMGAQIATKLCLDTSLCVGVGGWRMKIIKAATKNKCKVRSCVNATVENARYSAGTVHRSVVIYK